MTQRLWLLLLFALPLPAQDRDDEEQHAQYVHFVEKLEPVVVIEKDGAAEALKVYQEWAKTADKVPMSLAKMKEIYSKAGKGMKAFKTVAHLIATEQIKNDHSVAMAQVREAEIEKLILEIAESKEIRVARSDSGNVSAGMKSDLDQTFYVFEKKIVDGEVTWERAPTRDGGFIQEFNELWKQRHGEALSVEAVDIASIEGRNRFPDPRLEVKHGFWNEHRRVAEALRHTPGAYTTAGAVGHQMQFRALAAILEGNVRAYQVYGPDEEGAYRNLGTDKKEAIETMFGKRPDLRPGFAFDAALANFLELQHYMWAKKFETKYHLRTFEDGLHSLYLARQKKGRLLKVDLTKLTPKSRKKKYMQVLKDVFPDPDQRRLHEMALEISVKQRRRHQGKLEATDLEIFEELGKQIHGDKWSAGYVEGVRRRFRQLASEFCLETAFHTASESFVLLVSKQDFKTLNLKRYRKILKVKPEDWPKTVEHLRDAAHITFLFGIYDLGLVKSAQLMNRLRQKHGMKHLPYLFGLWARGQVQGFESIYREPGRYARLYKDMLDANLDVLSDRVQKYVLSEIGYEYADTLGKVAGEAQMAWSGRKFARNMVYDPGNIDALAQVVRVFFESGGNWNAVKAAIVDEMIMAVPIAGQVVAASRGGIAGTVAMGAAMACPQIGGVLVLVSLAQTGYAIYDVEKLRPIARNSENAVYRGYVGPETRAYDAAPPRFTSSDDLQSLRDLLNRKRPKPPMKADPTRLPKELERYRQEMEEYKKLEAEILPQIAALEKQAGQTDEDRLKDLRFRLEVARPHAPKMRHTYDRKVVEEDLAKHKKTIEEFKKLEKELLPQIEALEAKQRAWDAYTYDPAAGGKLTGAGAQLRQRPFRNHLLKKIKPVVAFSPKGVVDFRAQKHDLNALDQAVRNATTPQAMVEAELAYREAVIQNGRRERADRWRAADSLEMRHKIHRDSLHPGLKALGYDDPVRFVDDFFKGNEAVLNELLHQGLLEPDGGPIRWKLAYPQPIPVYTKLTAFPEASLKALKARIRQDFERSKVIFERYEELEKNRKEKARLDVEKRLGAFEGAAAGVAVERLGKDEMLRRLYEAMRNPDVEADPPAPQFEATVYKVDEGYDVSAEVRADPAVNPPPYRFEIRALSPTEAWDAKDLLPMAKERLKEVFQGKKPKKSDDKQGVYFFVVTGTDANKETIGQSLHLTWEPKEVKEDRTWFLRLDHQDPLEVAVPMLKKRFPQARLKRVEPKPLQRGPVPVHLVAHYIDWNEAQARADRKDWDGISDAVGVNYDPFQGTARAGGRTHHVYKVRLPRGYRTQLSTPYFSLPDGRHEMELDITLQNGARVRQKLAFHVKRKGKSYVAMMREGLQKNRARVAKSRSRSTLGNLRSSLHGLARAMLDEGAGGSVGQLTKECFELIPEMRRLGATERRPPKESSFLRLVSTSAFLCERIGGNEGYKILKAARDDTFPRVSGATYESQKCHIEQSLARIQLNMGNVGAARAHWQRFLDHNARRKRPDGMFHRDLDKYWPK